MIDTFFSKHFEKPTGEIRRPRMQIKHVVIRQVYEEYGICSSKDGFFRLVDPEEWQKDYLPWFSMMAAEDSAYLPAELYPFMTTAFGFPCMFANREQSVFAGYVDITTNDHLMGPAQHVFNEILLDPITYRFNLHGEFYDKLIASQPALGPDECLGFFPPLSLGGELELDHVKRVGLREHLDFLAQVAGLPTQ